MAGCRPLSDNEVTLVLNQLVRDRDRALFVLGLKTGFRITELLSVKVSDVFQNGHVSDYLRIERRNMKGSSRVVVLNDLAKRELSDYIKKSGLENNNFLFKSRVGENRAISRFQAWSILKMAFAFAGLSGHLATHSMRKSFAKKVHKALGNDLFMTQKALGHKSIMSTIAYLPVDQEALDNAVKAL